MTPDIAAIREWATCNAQRIKNARMGSSEVYDSVLWLLDEYERLQKEIESAVTVKSVRPLRLWAEIGDPLPAKPDRCAKLIRIEKID